MKDLLRLRDFRLLWMGQVTSNFGDALTNLALLITAQRLTGSVAAVASTAIAVALPQLLFGPVAGVYIDRWNRKVVMIASDLVRGVLVLGFVVIDDPDQLWLLYGLAFLQATVGTFFNPAKSAFVPVIVGEERLLAANSVGETSRVVAMLAGTAFAGLMAGLGDLLRVVFVVDGLTFVASGLLEMRIAADGRPEGAPSHRRVVADLGAGLRFVASSRTLVGVVVGGAVLMFGLGAVNVLLVPFVVDELALSEAWFGVLEGAQVTSMVIAGGLMVMLARRLRPTTIVTVALAGVGVVVAAVALVAGPWQLVLALFAAGWFVTPLQASVSTLVQSEVAGEMRGRVGSLLGTVLTSANVASMAAAGAAASLLGIRGVFVAAGAVAVLAALLTAVLFREVPLPAVARP
ncbi:MAG: MFS transporter [Acidimicrobiia bacterium]